MKVRLLLLVQDQDHVHVHHLKDHTIEIHQPVTNTTTDHLTTIIIPVIEALQTVGEAQKKNSVPLALMRETTNGMTITVDPGGRNTVRSDIGVGTTVMRGLGVGDLERVFLFLVVLRKSWIFICKCAQL